MANIITSINNPYIKEISKLKDKKYRTLNKKFIIEGVHLVKEAYSEDIILEIFTTNDNYQNDFKDIKITIVSFDIIKKLSDTTTPQDIVAVCKFKDTYIDYDKYKHILILDDVKDPGNVGTLIRTSLGFNIDAVILSENSCDIYSSKVLRSSQGAIFHIACAYKNIDCEIDIIKKHGIKVISTSLLAKTKISEIEKIENYAIILGNEANGVRKNIQEKADINVIIPIKDALESLNVAIAGAIMMYEVSK